MALARCSSCSRPIAIRWRKCRWCKRPTGRPWFAGNVRVDDWLDAIAWFGAPTALWIGYDGLLIAMHFERVGIAIQILAAAMFVGHLFLPWSKWGWWIAA